MGSESAATTTMVNLFPAAAAARCCCGRAASTVLEERAGGRRRRRRRSATAGRAGARPGAEEKGRGVRTAAVGVRSGWSELSGNGHGLVSAAAVPEEGSGGVDARSGGRVGRESPRVVVKRIWWRHRWVKICA